MNVVEAQGKGVSDLIVAAFPLVAAVATLNNPVTFKRLVEAPA
jgi:hypothetical protein